jgi:DNA-binding XRE family transcriptional regulator
MNRLFFNRRIDLGLSIWALAEKAGVSDRTVQRAENGEPIKALPAAALARALEVKIEDVFQFRGKVAYPLAPEPSEAAL